MKMWRIGFLIFAGLGAGKSALAFTGEPISPQMIRLATSYLDLITSNRFTNAITTNGNEGAELSSHLDSLESAMIRLDSSKSPYLAAKVNLLSLLIVTRRMTFSLLFDRHNDEPQDDSLLDRVAACQTFAKISLKRRRFAGWKSGDHLCLDIEPGTPPSLVVDTSRAYLSARLAIAKEKQKQYEQQSK